MSGAYFDLLRRMPIFGGLNDNTLSLITSQSSKRNLTANEYFFRMGDAAQSLFVLQRGVAIVERDWNGTPIMLGRLEQGDCIGEMALIDLMPRSASVRAEDNCCALEIRLTSLHDLYKQELEQYAMIMMNLGREVSRRLRLADDRLFDLVQCKSEQIS